MGEEPLNRRTRVVRMPMLDTGLGREAGYRDDAELVAAAEAERRAMTPLEREILDRIHTRMEDELINGRDESSEGRTDE